MEPLRSIESTSSAASAPQAVTHLGDRRNGRRAGCVIVQNEPAAVRIVPVAARGAKCLLLLGETLITAAFLEVAGRCLRLPLCENEKHRSVQKNQEHQPERTRGSAPPAGLRPSIKSVAEGQPPPVKDGNPVAGGAEEGGAPIGPDRDRELVAWQHRAGEPALHRGEAGRV
jgi:hypothetical protein